MTEVAGYIRVSTPGQAKEGESLATQRQAIESYAENKGWELVAIYEDAGISGSTTAGRPALLELLEDAPKGKFDVLIIPRLSRLGRNARDLLNNIQTLRDNEVVLISLKEQIDLTTPFGRALVTMLAAIVELERETIKEQMEENKLAKWKDGRTFLGQPPFGYVWNKETKGLDEHSVMCGPVNSIEEVVNDPHVQAREMIQEVTHSRAGKLKVVGTPMKFSRTPCQIEKASPDLGEHTEEIASSLLGLSEEELETLRKEGVI